MFHGLFRRRDDRSHFNSGDSLVPADANGRMDAYSWHDGRVELVSTGKSSGDSYFADSSDEGTDVYFVTRERLVSSDVDRLLDLYDARVGGGFPELRPAIPPCSNEGCQGRLGGTGRENSLPGSAALRGEARAPRVPRFWVTPVGSREAKGWVTSGRLVLHVRVSDPGRVRASAFTVSPQERLASASRKVLHAGHVRLVLQLPKPVRMRLGGSNRVAVVIVRYSRVSQTHHIRIKFMVVGTRDAKGKK